MLPPQSVQPITRLKTLLPKNSNFLTDCLVLFCLNTAPGHPEGPGSHGTCCESQVMTCPPGRAQGGPGCSPSKGSGVRAGWDSSCGTLSPPPPIPACPGQPRAAAPSEGPHPGAATPGASLNDRNLLPLRGHHQHPLSSITG